MLNSPRGSGIFLESINTDLLHELMDSLRDVYKSVLPLFCPDSYKVHSCAQKRFHDKNDFEVEPSEKQRITITGDKPVRKSNKENSLCRNNVTIKTKESYSDDLKKHEKKAPKHEKVKHEFLDKLYEIMLRDGFMKARDRNERVLEFTHPEDLRKKIDFDLGSKTSDEKILSLCQDVIKYSVKVGKKRKLSYNFTRFLKLHLIYFPPLKTFH